jgi:Fic family protein
MMIDATQFYDQPLTKERLLGWHAALFPTGYSGISRIKVGAWRDGPIQVVSGPAGREWVHFEAPPSERIHDEMASFLEWLNHRDNMDLVLKAFVAHIWFVTIHPFDDGNGRIARAIADMLLARSEKSSQRFYSMSAQIRVERKAYYDILEDAQKSTLDITETIGWFLGCLQRALDGAESMLADVLRKARFWDKYSRLQLNERQRKMTNLLLDGLEGKLTSTKWSKITKCSQDTASRDINDLIDKGILVKDNGGGRSTSYSLRET